MTKFSINRGILKRLAIVLTVLFIVGFTAGTAMPTIAKTEAAIKEGYDECIDAEGRKSVSDLAHCERMKTTFSDFLDERRGGIWQDAFLNALGLTVIIWLLTALAYAVTRWVLNGRTEEAR